MILLYGMASVALAHLPNIASYTLIEGETGWQLEVALPTDGMHHALQAQYPGEPLSGLSVADYEVRLVEAIEPHLALWFDGNPVALTEPVVGLAPHETRVRFTATPQRPPTRVIETRIDVFGHIPGQYNVFTLVTRDRADRVVLSPDNDYRTRIALRPAEAP